MYESSYYIKVVATVLLMYLNYVGLREPMNFKTLLDLLWDLIPKWEQLGVSLLIDKTTLDCIKLKHPQDPSGCFIEILTKWLQQDMSSPPLRTLYLALRSPSMIECSRKITALTLTSKFIRK